MRTSEARKLHSQIGLPMNLFVHVFKNGGRVLRVQLIDFIIDCCIAFNLILFYPILIVQDTEIVVLEHFLQLFLVGIGVLLGFNAFRRAKKDHKTDGPRNFTHFEVFDILIEI